MKTLVAALMVLVAFVPVASADPLPEPVDHVDVFLPPFMGCTWSGSYKPYVETPAATVWVYTCDPET